MLKGLVRNWMSAPVVTVSPETSLNEARRIMNAEKIRALPVIENEKLVGIVTRRTLLRADPSFLDASSPQRNVGQLRDEHIARVMTTNLLTIAPEAPLPRAARIMMENKITALPVVDASGALAGILTTSDIFRALLAELPGLKQDLRVKDYMTAEVVTITTDTSLLECHRLMGVKRIRTLPVVDGEKLIGIVTRSDVLSADPSRVYANGDQKVSLDVVLQDVESIMVRNVITIAAEDSVLDAAQAMLQNKFHSLPVVEKQDELCGVITETDLFRLMVQKFL